jgi:hypothetical protein
LFPCSFCGHRMVSGTNHVYWFIVNTQTEPTRLRQRLCDDCFAANVLAMLTPEAQDDLTCPACGMSTMNDVFPIYVTYYQHRSAAERGAMALCAEHNQELSLRAHMNATELEDRYLDSTDTQLLAPASATDRVVRVGPPARPTPQIPADQLFRSLGRRDPGPKHGA